MEFMAAGKESVSLLGQQHWPFIQLITEWKQAEFVSDSEFMIISLIGTSRMGKKSNYQVLSLYSIRQIKLNKICLFIPNPLNSPCWEVYFIS